LAIGAIPASTEVEDENDDEDDDDSGGTNTALNTCRVNAGYASWPFGPCSLDISRTLQSGG